MHLIIAQFCSRSFDLVTLYAVFRTDSTTASFHQRHNFVSQLDGRGRVPCIAAVVGVVGAVEAHEPKPGLWLAPRSNME